MGAGLGIAGCTEIVVDAVAAETEFQELGAITVPLKDHRLGPIVPDGSRNHQVLAQEDFDGLATHERSEEHTSELQSHLNLVCRLLLEKKNINKIHHLHC